MVRSAAPFVTRRYSVWVSCQWRPVVKVEGGWIVTVVMPEGGEGVGFEEGGLEEGEEEGARGKAKVVFTGRSRVKEMWWVVFVRGIVLGCSWGFLLFRDGSRGPEEALMVDWANWQGWLVCFWQSDLGGHALLYITSCPNGSISRISMSCYYYALMGSLGDGRMVG